MEPDDIKTFQAELGLTTIAMADHLGVHRNTYDLWVKGERKAPYALKLYADTLRALKKMIADLNAFGRVAEQVPAIQPKKKDK